MQSLLRCGGLLMMRALRNLLPSFNPETMPGTHSAPSRDAAQPAGCYAALPLTALWPVSFI